MHCRFIRRNPSSATTMFVVAVVLLAFRQSDAQAQAPPDLSRLAPAALASHEETPTEVETGQSSRELRTAAVAAIPLTRLTPAARQRISSIVDRPSLFRHLPTRTIDCDPELFMCIARQPELLVGIWEVMGITQVKTERLDQYRLVARDGSGTTCTVDLVYGDRNTQIYVADGYYDGKLVASKLTGKGVFVLRTKSEIQGDGLDQIAGTMDCFVQLDNLGADLIVRTFGPLIGKTADSNFAETAKFIGQIGLTARQNPEGLQDLSNRLPQVDASVRQKFVDVIDDADRRNQARLQARSISRAPGAVDPTHSVR